VLILINYVSKLIIIYGKAVVTMRKVSSPSGLLEQPRDGRRRPARKVADMIDNGATAKRNCAQDTKAMVEFGMFLFEKGWKDNYHEELDHMNDGKNGHPFVLSRSLIL